MNSPNIESVAADSNVLLSAAAGQAARRVFDQTELIVVTTEHNVAEVIEYIPVFAARYRLSEAMLLQLWESLRLQVFAENYYRHRLRAAADLLAGRDADDVPLAALALARRIPIWSNDRDYENFPYGNFSTARLLTILGI